MSLLSTSTWHPTGPQRSGKQGLQEVDKNPSVPQGKECIPSPLAGAADAGYRDCSCIGTKWQPAPHTPEIQPVRQSRR